MIVAEQVKFAGGLTSRRVLACSPAINLSKNRLQIAQRGKLRGRGGQAFDLSVMVDLLFA